MKIEYKKDGIVVGDVFLLLSDIIEECNTVKIKENNLVLLEIGWDGRGGSVFEQIALPKESALRIKDTLLNQEVYFGEIWGKHSEVYGEVSEEDFKIVADKKKIKNFLEEYPSGHNYDHSFIYTFIEYNEEQEMQDGITQEILDELKNLIKYK
jgi:hypothetical protein